jgi:hypothetical protein
MWQIPTTSLNSAPHFDDCADDLLVWTNFRKSQMLKCCKIEVEQHRALPTLR